MNSFAKNANNPCLVESCAPQQRGFLYTQQEEHNCVHHALQATSIIAPTMAGSLATNSFAINANNP